MVYNFIIVIDFMHTLQRKNKVWYTFMYICYTVDPLQILATQRCVFDQNDRKDSLKYQMGRDRAFNMSAMVSVMLHSWVVPLWKTEFSKFSCMFLNPSIFFPNLNSNCSDLLDLRTVQEQVKKAFCWQKLFWPLTVWINCSGDFKNVANS